MISPNVRESLCHVDCYILLRSFGTSSRSLRRHNQEATLTTQNVYQLIMRFSRNLSSFLLYRASTSCPTRCCWRSFRTCPTRKSAAMRASARSGGPFPPTQDSGTPCLSDQRSRDCMSTTSTCFSPSSSEEIFWIATSDFTIDLESY